MNVRTLSTEVAVIANLHMNDKIACGAPLSNMPFLSNTQVDPVVDPFWYFNGFLGLDMDRAFSSTGHTRVTNYSTSSITSTTDLLDHKRALSNRDETLTTTRTACRSRCSRFGPRALAGSTGLRAPKRHHFLCPVNSIHEVYLHINYDVLSLCLGLCPPCILLATEHLLELLKDVSKGTAPGASTSLRPPELVRETLEACKTLASSEGATSPSERVLPTKGVLRLLIARHSCLVIHSSLPIVTQSLVSVVDLAKLFLRLCRRVHIWMVLFGELKVSLLDVGLRRVPIHIEHRVEVFRSVPTASPAS